MATIASAIYDPQARQSCSLAGVSMMKGKLVQLQDLQKIIENNIVEADKAETEGDLIRAMLFSLRVIKATCDATIGILVNFAPAGGKVVGAVYGGAEPFATNLGKLTAGQNVSGAEWAKAVNAGAMNAVKGANPDSIVGDLASLQKFKNDIIIDAVNQDEKAILKDLTGYGIELTKMTVKYAGAKTWAKVIGIGKQQVTAGQKFAEAYQELKDGDISGQMQGAKRMAKAQLLRVQQQIGALSQAIADCELTLSSSKAPAVAGSSNVGGFTAVNPVFTAVR